MRANGKLIADELPIKDPRHDISCVQAIMTYEEICRSMRKLASEKHARSLFLYAPRAVTTIPQTKWRRWFQAFRRRHKEISHLPFQARMIRPSLLMQAAFENDTGISPPLRWQIMHHYGQPKATLLAIPRKWFGNG
jgi:hypothetical protein